MGRFSLGARQEDGLERDGVTRVGNTGWLTQVVDTFVVMSAGDTGMGDT